MKIFKRRYRMLREGEIIRRKDYLDICNDGYKDDPVWVELTTSGGVVPNPLQISHRRYLRPLANWWNPVSWFTREWW